MVDGRATMFQIIKVYTSYIFDTSTSSLYSNGILIASGTTGTASMGGNYTLGARYSGIEYNIEGSIYEHCIYSAKLTTEQPEKVEGYIAHKWNLTTELPSKIIQYKTILLLKFFTLLNSLFQNLAFAKCLAPAFG